MFLQLYRLLSVYSLIKPPKFGNCSIMEEKQHQILDVDVLKSLYAEDISKETHIKTIKEVINALTDYQAEQDTTDDIIENEILNIMTLGKCENTTDCIIYYLSGFICKKLSKLSNCSVCRQYLIYKEPLNTLPYNLLINIKNRGALTYANTEIFNVCKVLENIIAKHLNSIDIFDLCLQDIYENSSTFQISLSCEIHKENTISNLIYFYSIMRVKQFYKQCEQNS